MFTQAEVFAFCERIGETGVRERLNSGQWNEKIRIRHAQEWLRLHDKSRSDASAPEKLDIANSQLETANSQLAAANSQLEITISQLLARESQLRAVKTQRNAAVAAVIVTIIIATIKIYFF